MATDLDGTLLRSDHTVGRRTRNALAHAVGRGAEHVVVTGRSVAWTRPLLDDLGYAGPAVCGQGGQVYDAAARTQVFSVLLDRRIAREASSGSRPRPADSAWQRTRTERTER